MPRKPTAVDGASVRLLQQFVRKKANLPCTSFSDMQQLQQQIRKSVDEYLSIQTLNRFFGLIRNDFKPAAVTLDIFARYLNYSSFQEFEVLNRHSADKCSELSSSAQLIIYLLSNVQPGSASEGGLLNVLKNTVKLLEQEPSLHKDLYPFMAQTEFGRKYFYEQFVNLDALNAHYGEGLVYYLLHTQNLEQQFFAYCLLCQRYFLTGQHQLFNCYYNKISEYKPSEIKTFHTFLVGRYYAVTVYNNILNNEPVDCIDEAMDMTQKINRSKENFGCFPSAEYVFAEALILAQEYSAAYQLLQQGRRHLTNIPSSVDRGFVTQYQLLLLYAGYFSGRITAPRALAELQDLQARPLYFLSQDYYSIFVQVLNKALQPKGLAKSANEQIHRLIEKTGFVHFKKEEALAVPEEVWLMDIKGKQII